MPIESRIMPELADEGTVHSFNDYLSSFVAVCQWLPATITHEPAWLDTATKLCRLSRCMTHAAIRENLDNPDTLSNTIDALCVAAKWLNRSHEESANDEVRKYRDHVGERIVIFRAKLKAAGSSSSMVVAR